MAKLDHPVGLPLWPVICREAEMLNQGRLLKAVLLLMVAMTAGALILLALEGKPIRRVPMGYSLLSQSRLNSFDIDLQTEVGLELGRWQDIKVYFELDNGRLSSRFGPTGTLAISYHFVISNGSTGRDGQIYPTNRWRSQMPCLNTSTGSERTLRICLLRDSAKSKQTGNQGSQLDILQSKLVKLCQINRKSSRKKP
ncbi:MAG: hypothetical protein KAT56_08635 [Sedimentisphaerales bacterium]|nr:hypothetical protein [Sedimentisphaerales bacterium]